MLDYISPNCLALFYLLCNLLILHTLTKFCYTVRPVLIGSNDKRSSSIATYQHCALTVPYFWQFTKSLLITVQYFYRVTTTQLKHDYSTETSNTNYVSVNYTCLLHIHASIFKFPVSSVTSTG